MTENGAALPEMTTVASDSMNTRINQKLILDLVKP